MARQRVTLKAIAEAAGSTVPTVARILAGKNKESWPSAAKRAEEIRRIARELGYRPDHSARALASQRAHCIALAFGAEEPLYGGVYAPVLARLIKAAAARGYDLLAVPVVGPARNWEAKLIDSRVDGMLVMQPLTAEMPELIARYAIPSVLLNLKHPKLSVPQVVFDDAGGAAAAVAHLAELGHRAIAYDQGSAGKDGDGAVHYHLAERRAGFEAACAERGVTGRVLDLASPGEVLDALGDETAICCRTDRHAIGLLRAARERGLDVPAALSVVGCNDEAIAAATIPALTTIRVPVTAMVDRGLALLLDAIESGRPGKRRREIVLEEALVVRDSTGPAPTR